MDKMTKLKKTWLSFLDKIDLPSTRMLLSQQANFSKIDENEVVIAVSPNWARMINSRRVVIENAVKKVFGDNVNTQLITQKKNYENVIPYALPEHRKRIEEATERAVYGTCKYPNCGGVCDSRLTPSRPNIYGEVYCRACNRHQKWLPFPDTPEKKRKKTGQKLLKQKIPFDMMGFCEICLRDQFELKILELNLEVHHVIPVSQNGSDETQNLRLLCTHCHQLVEKQRKIYIRYSKLLDSNKNKLD